MFGTCAGPSLAHNSALRCLRTSIHVVPPRVGVVELVSVAVKAVVFSGRFSGRALHFENQPPSAKDLMLTVVVTKTYFLRR